MKRIYFKSMLFGAVVLLATSCTKLNEEVLDESLSTRGLTERQIADGQIAPIYALLPNLHQHTTYFALQEISTDEAILPYRGGTDWGDNGIYLSLHRHETTSTDPNVRNTWNIIVQGISRSVSAIFALKNNNDAIAPTYIAEARAMRAFYNLVSLDLFGIAFIKDDPGAVSKIIRGTEAVNYLKSELTAVEPLLDNTTGPGRITRAGVWGLLAKLHLNAGVYRDRYADAFQFTSEDMNEVISNCDKIISSGVYALSADYFAIFGDNNHTSKELVFAVDQRADLNGHNRLAYFSLSGDQFPLTAFPAANGTDGPGITSDFYRTWVNAYPVDPAQADPRFYKQNISIYTNPGDSCVTEFHMDRGILRGQQFGLIRRNGVFEKCPDGKFKVGKLFNASRSNPNLPVEFTELINFTTAGSNYSTGYRVEKYEFSRKSASGRNFGEADISIIRLADVYLMRAEAKLRNNNATGALADVNAVRLARTAYAVKPTPLSGTFTLDLLFRERGFEFYWEMTRRTDMIRFGKYEGTWTEKTNTDKRKRIFPIPQNAIDGASNLPQYLVQNEGY